MTIRVPVREADLDLLVAGVCNIKDLFQESSFSIFHPLGKLVPHLHSATAGSVD